MKEYDLIETNDPIAEQLKEVVKEIKHLRGSIEDLSSFISGIAGKPIKSLKG